MLEFSAAEMRRRRTAFGRELERNGTAYALVYGANRSGSAVSWLTGWPVTREALLVVAPQAEDDVLLVSFFNHVPQARRLAVTRVEWAGARAVATALVSVRTRHQQCADRSASASCSSCKICLRTTSNVSSTNSLKSGSLRSVNLEAISAQS